MLEHPHSGSSLILMVPAIGCRGRVKGRWLVEGLFVRKTVGEEDGGAILVTDFRRVFWRGRGGVVIHFPGDAGAVFSEPKRRFCESGVGVLSFSLSLSL